MSLIGAFRYNFKAIMCNNKKMRKITFSYRSLSADAGEIIGYLMDVIFALSIRELYRNMYVMKYVNENNFILIFFKVDIIFIAYLNGNLFSNRIY